MRATKAILNRARRLGSDPGARLLAFQRAVQEQGWRGLGLWNRMSDPEYAVQAANWSKQAGITYLLILHTKLDVI